MSKKILGVIVAIVLVGAVFLMPEAKSETPETVEDKTVYVINPVRESVMTGFQVNGYVEGAYELIDATTLQGQVEDVFVKKGDQVKLGDALVELDIESSMDDINYQLKQLSASISEVALSKQQYYDKQVKMETLYSSGAVSKEDMDSVKNQVDQYSLQYDKLVEQKRQLAKSKSNMESRSVIKSSCSGVVTDLTLSPGDYISQSDQIKIEKTGQQSVQIDMTEAFIQLVQPGKSVEVKIGTEQMEGTIRDISDGGGQDHLYTVKVDLSMDKTFKSGCMATVTIPEYQNDSALLVNRRAVIQYEGETYVYRVKDGTVLKTPVETGIWVDGNMEILEGLQMNDDVILKGQFSVSEGETVKAIRE